MFASNDPTFREPEKVMLKSSDDLILFGQDLIKDVLNDTCQVHVLIESLKDAPTISDLYEQICTTKDTLGYSNIKNLLKSSEENFSLNLEEISLNISESVKHFDVIAETIRLNNKTNPDYLKNLNQIDLSSNFLTDQILGSVLEGILVHCTSLKSLNLSMNLLSSKSIKNLNDCAVTAKLISKNGSIVNIYSKKIFLFISVAISCQLS
jgi:hypothetical protein